MRTKPIIAGVAAGAILAGGGIAAFDIASQDAGAQGGGRPLTAAQGKQLSQQSIVAIRRATKALNNTTSQSPAGEVIGLRTPDRVIRQESGSGTGWQGGAIQNGAISGDKLGDGAVGSRLSVQSQGFSLADDDAEAFRVLCPPGQAVISGAWNTDGFLPDVSGEESILTPEGGQQGWGVVILNTSGESINGNVQAICVR